MAKSGWILRLRTPWRGSWTSKNVPMQPRSHNTCDLHASRDGERSGLDFPLNSPGVHLVFSRSVSIRVVRRELSPQLLGAVDTLLYRLRYQLFASVLTGITG